MLQRMIIAEYRKLRHARIWIAFVVLPAVTSTMGAFNYAQNREVLSGTWDSLWTQHTLFSCYLFMPALIGACCAWLWRIERSGGNWGGLWSQPVPVTGVVTAKLVVYAAMMLVAQAVTLGMFVVSGWLLGFSDALPPAYYAWVGMGFLAALVIGATQLLVSLWIRSFAGAVGIALGGGTLGLMLSTQGLGHLWPYSLYSMAMRANGATDVHVGALLVSCLAYASAVPVLMMISLRKLAM